MQNYTKSQTRLAFVQYIFQNEFLNADSSESIEDEYKTLLNELSNHSKDLIKKPKVLFITKADVMHQDEYADIDRPKDIDSMIISSINGFNIKDSIQGIKKILQL